MTVTEIKEYIKQRQKYYKSNNFYKITDVHSVILDFEQIGIMLDELEERPKAKWIKTPLSYYDDDYGYECSNCKEIYCTEYDFEEMAYNYCPNCGARIDNELEE